MEFIIYLKCFVVASLGQLLSVALILNSLNKKARLANLEFSFKSYLKDDAFLLAGNFIWILVCLFAIDFFIKWKPEWEIFLVPIFAFNGYIGSDIPTRLASVANKKLNSAIDYKTTIADTATGTLEKPTPTK